MHGSGSQWVEFPARAESHPPRLETCQHILHQGRVQDRRLWPGNSQLVCLNLKEIKQQSFFFIYFPVIQKIVLTKLFFIKDLVKSLQQVFILILETEKIINYFFFNLVRLYF